MKKCVEIGSDRIVYVKKTLKYKEKRLNEGSYLSPEKAIDIARSYELNQMQLNILNVNKIQT